MITASVRARLAGAEGRLDARFHLSPGMQAREHLSLLAASGVTLRPVAGPSGLGTVAKTSRTKRVYAGRGEKSVSYLRPYDVFDYLPQSADELSVSGSQGVERLTPEVGTILQTCSGRNLGPLAYVDKYIAGFAVSDDMLRLSIPDPTERAYAYAFLCSPTGQALLTQTKFGAVIDHLAPADLEAVEVPFIDSQITTWISTLISQALELRESARLRLNEILQKYVSSLPPIVAEELVRDGWTQSAAALHGRIDSAYYEPRVVLLRELMIRAGGRPVGDVAETFIPGRYKRYYVDPEHGRPIVSGRQLLQTKPINLRYIADRSINYEEFALQDGMVAFGAEGRAEERIAQPTLVTGDRAMWLANNHVMRVRPKERTSPGWLYLAFAAPQTQAQVKAFSCGSVVDSVYAGDLDTVILPPEDPILGAEAEKCWRDFDHANQLEAEAVAAVETTILRVADSGTPANIYLTGH